MKRKRKRLRYAGMTVVLVGLICSLLFFIRVQPDPGRKHDTTTQHKEENHESSAEIRRQDTEESTVKKSIEVTGTGHLYYLDPEGNQTFQRRLTHFVSDQGIEADSAQVLEYCIDDRDKETEQAQFFLELNDDHHTIVRVSFEKPTGTYRFNLYDRSIPDDYDGEALSKDGREEETIPESTEDDETVPKSRLTITDPEGELKAAADMKELKKELRKFLRLEKEGRRNFYVGSVTATDNGYTALICFETVRQDGRNVEVSYDGNYHFQLV